MFLACTTLILSGYAHGLTENSAKSPPSVAPDFKPRLGTYHYQVDLNNVSFGNVKVVIGGDSTLYKVQVLAKSIGMMDSLYHLRYRSDTILDTEHLVPVEANIKQETGSNEKYTTITFHDDGTIKAIERKMRKGNTLKYKVREVQSDRFTLDPFSASYLVRGLDWKVGVEKVFDVYPGKYQYELRLKCEDLISLDMGSEKRKAWVIVSTVKNLDPKKQAKVFKKKTTPSKIYVSADELKDVLKIETNHLMGNFRVLMVKFDPAVAETKATNGRSLENDSQVKAANGPAKSNSQVKTNAPAKQETAPVAPVSPATK